MCLHLVAPFTLSENIGQELLSYSGKKQMTAITSNLCNQEGKITRIQYIKRQFWQSQ